MLRWNFKALLVLSLNFISLNGLAPANPFDDAGHPRHTQEIVRQAKSAEMRNYLNVSHDPCQDFYTFACGSYDRINPPTALQYQRNVFQSILKSLSRKISILLKSDEATDTATDKKVKNFYESCMKVGTLQNDYKAKLQEIIGEFGQMPALEGDKWQEAKFDWLQTVAEIAHKYNIHLILGYFIQVDSADNTMNRIRILVQDIPLQSASIYMEDIHAPLREIRKKVMVKNLKNFLGIEARLAEQTAKEIFDFEAYLFAGYNSAEKDPTEPKEGPLTKSTLKNNKTAEPKKKPKEENTTGAEPKVEYTTEAIDRADSEVISNLITIDEMQSKYFPPLDIKRLINISLGSVPSERVYDLIEDQFDNIANALANTPKRIVANYIFYYLVEMFLFNTPKDTNLLQELCIKTTKSHFAKVIDNMIYRKYTTNQTEQDVDDMWHLIKSTFQNVLQSDKLTWMKEDTRKYALEKLKNIRLEINAYQKTNFSEEFGALTITSNDYVENIKSILGLSALGWRSKLNESPKPYDNPQLLSFTPVYIHVENLIKVPVSLLQPYFFWSDSYPKALKFGTLGFLISHELIHGFDEDGRTYDKTGNKHEWWDQGSSEYFNNQTQCFSAQYHEYIYDGIQLPQLESQAENTADNGGIRLAHNAYRRWYEETLRSYQKSDLEKLPHMDYTSEQLFFISYGQMWCSATHPILRNYAASIDDHVPNKFRVIGPLSNLKEFSTAFSCPPGSGMNPETKCIIY